MKLSEKKWNLNISAKKTQNQRIKMKQLIQTNFYEKPHCDKINFYYLESMLWIQREN